MEIKLTRNLRPNSLSAEEYMRTVVFAGITDKIWIDNITSHSLGNNQEEITVFCRSLRISGLENELVNIVETAISARSDLSQVSIRSTGISQPMFIAQDRFGNEICGVNARSVDAEYDQQLKIDKTMSVTKVYEGLKRNLTNLQDTYPTFAKGVLSLLGKVDDVTYKLVSVALPRQKDIHTDSIKKEIDNINKNFVSMRNVVMAYSKKGVKAKRKFLRLLRRTIGKLLETIELNSGLISDNNKNAKALMGNLKKIIYPTYKTISEKLGISSSLPTVDLEFLQTSGANCVTPVWLDYFINLINTGINSLSDAVTYYVTQHAIQAVICYLTQHAIQAVAGSCFSGNGITLFSHRLMGEPCASLAPNSSLSLTCSRD